MVQSAPQIQAAVEFELNGQSISAHSDETILQAAQRNGVEIPHLCYSDGLRADGNCRACVVEIDGERTLAPSCCRYPSAGMKVSSDGDRAVKSQKMVLELLKTDTGVTVYNPASELDYWCDKLDVQVGRFEARERVEADLSHPAIAVNLDACIQCTRCVRACREEQVNDVIGLAYRGDHSAIVFDIDDPMAVSSCVGCGECVAACPTGALMPSNDIGKIEADRVVDSVCPFCGVGCLLSFHVKDEKVFRVEGRDGPSNHNRLCVKGRYGFDYIHNPERLTQPLIRIDGVPKGINEFFDPADPLKMFRPASWEEALAHAATPLREIREQHGPSALAGFGSAKGSNEEAYLFQKLVRAGFGTNNVDHCTRLCHASSVMALLEGVGSGAVSNPVEDVALAECIVLIGSNPSANHPVAATFIKNAVKNGSKLVVMDPRQIPIGRHADHYLQFKPDSDVAMLNALLYTIIEEDLIDPEFIASRTNNFEQLKANVKDFSPEAMAEVCGIEASELRAVARLYANSKSSMILWGMGVSQHVHGTDNVRCLIALAMTTGQIGRPGTGLHPLRGQNNVQGASDAGLIPMSYPDYVSVADPQAHKRYSEYWGAELDDKPGLTVVEIMHAAHRGDIKGLYIMGENPAMSDPNLNHARQAMAALDHMVVQDIFLTETCAFADVVLPASAWPEKDGTVSNTDRRVQMGRQAVAPPGDARHDLWIIEKLANSLGLDWKYDSAAAVYEEMRIAMDKSITGITWARLLEEESVTYPCLSLEDPGQSVVFVNRFPTVDGKANLVPTQLISADETPDTEYPYVLITGRQLEHWHTGSMTRRASVLDTIEPIATLQISPDDSQKLGIVQGDEIEITSRRGAVVATARVDRGLSPGQVFLPFAFHEAAANLLTNEALDPVGKIPEFKYCAVKLSAKH